MSLPNQLIHIGRPLPFDADDFLKKLQTLLVADFNNQEDIIREHIASIVLTHYLVNRQCDKIEEQVPQEQLTRV